jgi:hypothetical protein
LDPKGALQKIQLIPEIWNPIQEAGDEINRLWKAAQKGLVVWREYCLAGEIWRGRFSESIENGKSRSGKIIQKSQFSNKITIYLYFFIFQNPYRFAPNQSGNLKII